MLTHEITPESFAALEIECADLRTRCAELIARADRPAFATGPELLGVAHVIRRLCDPSEPLPDEAKPILFKLAQQLEYSMVNLGFSDIQTAGLSPLFHDNQSEA